MDSSARSLRSEAHLEMELDSQREWIVGRSSSADICIEWDPFLSRQHVRIGWEEGIIHLARLDHSKNRILLHGKPVDCCDLVSGEEVQIGSTLFRFVNESVSEQQALFYEEISFTSEELRLKTDHKAERHLQILSSLPTLLEHQSSVESLIEVILRLLTQGVTEADGILVICDETTSPAISLAETSTSLEGMNSPPDSIRVVRHFSRLSTGSAPQLSRRLWRRSLTQAHGALLHLWDHSSSETIRPGELKSQDLTTDTRYDWAFCLPVSFCGEQTHGIYVYGRWHPGDSVQRERIDADIRFVNLLVEISTAVVQARQLDRQRVLLEQFLPREVASLMILQPESTLLEPRECEMTVVYCDVQGFTARAEHSTDLLEFLEQISSELECASRAVLKYSGIIGDFHGDSVMGFWGWPIQNRNAAALACRAAQEIQQNLLALQDEEAEIPHGKMRIGIASGKGLAGKIGTSDQVKVTAFGTVVNRAERLQQLGKQVGHNILVDHETIERIPANLLGQEFQFTRHPDATVPGIPDPIRFYSLH